MFPSGPVLESVPFGVHLYSRTPDGGLALVYANRQSGRLLGRGRLLRTGMPVEESLSVFSSASAGLPGVLRRLAADGGTHACTVVRGKRCFSLQAYRFEPGRVAVYLHDVTGRDKNGHQRNGDMTYYHGLLATSPHGIAVCGIDGTLLFANEAAAKMFGFPDPGAMIGTNAFGYLDVSEIPRAVRNRAEVLENGAKKQVAYTAVRRDGARFLVETSCAVVRDALGRPASLMLVMRDISMQAALEAKLEEKQRFIERIVSTTPDWICIYDYDERETVYANDTMLRGLGFVPDTDGKSQLRLESFLHPDDIARLQRHYSRIPPAGRPRVWGTDCRYRRIDGEWRWAHCRTSVFQRGADGRVRQVICAAKDITGRKTREAQLKASREKLRALSLRLALVSEQERRIVAEYLHDHIAQALAAARIQISSISADAPRDTAASLARIDGAIDSSIGLIRSLMYELSVPALYKLGFEAGVAWLADYFRQQHNMALKVTSDGSGDRLAGDNRTIVFRVLRELCVNAAKHARVREALITIAGTAATLRITVADKGAGFDTAVLEDAARTSFGLFSVREQIESLGGRFSIRSAPGRGTRVAVALPLGRCLRGKKTRQVRRGRAAAQ